MHCTHSNGICHTACEQHQDVPTHGRISHRASIQHPYETLGHTTSLHSVLTSYKRVLTSLQTSCRTSMEVWNKNGFTHPLHLRLSSMCPSFIHHVSIAQYISNGVGILLYLTLIFPSIDSDHSSYLFSVNTVLLRSYYVQSTTQNNTRSDTTTCLLLCKVSLILPTYACFQYVSVVNNRPSSTWMT